MCGQTVSCELKLLRPFGLGLSKEGIDFVELGGGEGIRHGLLLPGLNEI